MILGTFWYETDGSWVRFKLEKNEENHVVRAEAAARSTEYPSLARDWVSVEGNDHTWAMNYEHNHADTLTKTYRLIDGTLYATEGKVNPLSQVMIVEVLSQDGTWGPYRKLREFNPFPEFEIKQVAEVTPFDKLPLIIEDQPKWNELREKDLRSGLVTSDISSFLSEQHATLLHELDTELAEFKANSFPTFGDYLKELDKILQEPENPVRKTIDKLVSRTAVDRDLGLNVDGDNEVRKQLVLRKLAFYLGLIRAEAKYIRELYKLTETTPEINIPAQIIEPVVIEQLPPTNPVAEVRNQNLQPENLVDVANNPFVDGYVYNPEDFVIDEDEEQLLIPLQQRNQIPAVRNDIDFVYNPEDFGPDVIPQQTEQTNNALPVINPFEDDYVYNPYDFGPDIQPQNGQSPIELIPQNTNNTTAPIIEEILSQTTPKEIIKPVAAVEETTNNREESVEIINNTQPIVPPIVVPPVVQETKKPEIQEPKKQDKPSNAPDLNKKPEPVIEPVKPALPLVSTREPVVIPEVDTRLQSLKNAITTAQSNYHLWYTGQKKDLRGPNGFFSWFRHGSYGQQKAVELRDEILSFDDLDAATAWVNKFLQHTDTRYNNHSLASFVVDELNKIPGLKDEIYQSAQYKPYI